VSGRSAGVPLTAMSDEHEPVDDVEAEQPEEEVKEEEEEDEPEDIKPAVEQACMGKCGKVSNARVVQRRGSLLFCIYFFVLSTCCGCVCVNFCFVFVWSRRGALYSVCCCVTCDDVLLLLCLLGCHCLCIWWAVIVCVLSVCADVFLLFVYCLLCCCCLYIVCVC